MPTSESRIAQMRAAPGKQCELNSPRKVFVQFSLHPFQSEAAIGCDYGVQINLKLMGHLRKLFVIESKVTEINHEWSLNGPLLLCARSGTSSGMDDWFTALTLNFLPEYPVQAPATISSRLGLWGHL
jgi:hypothetical protein